MYSHIHAYEQMPVRDNRVTPPTALNVDPMNRKERGLSHGSCLSLLQLPMEHRWLEHRWLDHRAFRSETSCHLFVCPTAQEVGQFTCQFNNVRTSI